jgi:hypothetical protein
MLYLLLLSCLSSAVAGDTDIDAVSRFDRKGAALPTRTIGASWDLQVPADKWPAVRTAAATSLVAFDAHLAAAVWMAPEAKTLYASLSPVWREQVRQAALGLAP